MRKPDFDNLLKVLNREVPDRPTLFEFFLNIPLYNKLTGKAAGTPITPQTVVDAFCAAGYDYANILAGYHFPRMERAHDKTVSMNEGAVITDRESFEKLEWGEVEDFDYSEFDDLKIPDGMKLTGYGPGGVEENVISLVGYDNLCMMLYDDPDLVQQIVDNVGSRLVKHYERLSEINAIGAMISNDDWGFQAQTMISPEDMRKYIIPWHKKIADTIHASGRPAILHSCGNLRLVMDDIIDVCKYDAKHSYEDKIQPVEDAYEEYHDRITLLGGIDLDFLCRKPIDVINKRCREMLERTSGRGGYALGSGNSIPEYVPDESYMAMISVINE